MFEKLKLLQRNQYLNKILATMLVITLTLANILLLGSYLTKGLISYAAGIDETTNEDNVKFKAYFKQNDAEVQTIDLKTNEETDIYLKISVKNTGYIENASVEFLNKNFEFKENNNDVIEINKIIQAGESIELKLPIKIFNLNKFDLDFLNMENQVKLTADYKQGEDTITIDSNKTFTLNWNPEDGITANLSEEVITNKEYEISGVQKRVIQLLVKSNISGNKYPIEQTNITIGAPTFSGTKPEQVKVMAYKTDATNGKTSLDFTNTNWTYNSSSGQIDIQIENQVDLNNEISWLKTGDDQILATFIYPNTIDPDEFLMAATNQIKLYNNQTILGNHSDIFSQEIETNGDIGTATNLDVTTTGDIYKGSMYTNQNSDYQVNFALNIGNADIAQKIIVTNDQEYYNDDPTKIANSYYKKTYISQAELEKVLGEEYLNKIVVLNIGTDPLEEITSITEEDGNLVITYPADSVSKIGIGIYSPIAEGQINILNEKYINPNEDKDPVAEGVQPYTNEDIESINKLSTIANLDISDSNDITIDTLDKTNDINILEPTTNIGLEINNNLIFTGLEENDITFTAILNTNSYSNKLFTNPTIDIELPKEITDVSINDVSLVNEDELTILSSAVETNDDGNKVIKIVFSGTQTQYDINAIQGGANVIIDTTVKTSQLLPNSSKVVKMTCVNDTETILNESSYLNIVSPNRTNKFK